MVYNTIGNIKISKQHITTIIINIIILLLLCILMYITFLTIDNPVVFNWV